MKFGSIILAALVFACVARSQETDTLATRTHAATFDPSRDAAQDINAAVTEAQASGKRVLLDVGGNWCKWCHMLDAYFEKDTTTARYLHDHFVVVKVNFSKENENKDVLAAYPKIPGYPHFFILEDDGTLLHSQDTGLLEKGQGYDAAKMMVFLKTWTK